VGFSKLWCFVTRVLMLLITIADVLKKFEKSPDQTPQECVTDKWDGEQHNRHLSIGVITGSYFFISFIWCMDPRKMFYSYAPFAFISY
jgi:hypothetical protein